MGAKEEDEVEELIVDGRHLTLASGTAEEFKKMMASPTFSGFRTDAQLKAELDAMGVKRTADGGFDFTEAIARSLKKPR